jgi:hypothetical protein
LPQPLDRLQPADDAERAVEAAAVRHRVEVRAGPDFGQLGPAPTQPPEEIPCRVDLDLEPGLAHPAGYEFVRLVLLARPAETVRARPAADRVQLVEPVQNPHVHSLSP